MNFDGSIYLKVNIIVNSNVRASARHAVCAIKIATALNLGQFWSLCGYISCESPSHLAKLGHITDPGVKGMATKVLAFAGSTRSNSFNKRLVQTAAKFVEEAGAVVTILDLRDYPLPLYDGDLEELEGAPAHATTLYELFKSHDALLISSPEYNSSISGVLKNTIDWVSRPRDGEPPLAAFTGKVAALFSASPGQLGGLRGLVHLRSILSNIGMLVIPDQVAVGAAHQAFDDDGSLVDEKLASRIHAAIDRLVRTASRLKGAE